MTETVNEDNTVFCTQCGHKHKLKDMLSTPFFRDGRSYYCPTVSKPTETARARKGELFYWNGREFEKVIITVTDEMAVIAKIEETSIFCPYCGDRHKLKDMDHLPYLKTGKNYYCPHVDDEPVVARTKNGELFYWNGKEFEKVILS